MCSRSGCRSAGPGDLVPEVRVGDLDVVEGLRDLRVPEVHLTDLEGPILDALLGDADQLLATVIQGGRLRRRHGVVREVRQLRVDDAGDVPHGAIHLELRAGVVVGLDPPERGEVHELHVGRKLALGLHAEGGEVTRHLRVQDPSQRELGQRSLGLLDRLGHRVPHLAVHPVVVTGVDGGAGVLGDELLQKTHEIQEPRERESVEVLVALVRGDLLEAHDGLQGELAQRQEDPLDLHVLPQGEARDREDGLEGLGHQLPAGLGLDGRELRVDHGLAVRLGLGLAVLGLGGALGLAAREPRLAVRLPEADENGDELAVLHLEHELDGDVRPAEQSLLVEPVALRDQPRLHVEPRDAALRRDGLEGLRELELRLAQGLALRAGPAAVVVPGRVGLVVARHGISLSCALWQNCQELTLKELILAKSYHFTGKVPI